MSTERDVLDALRRRLGDERAQDAAQAPQDGANGGDVGSGRGEGVSTPQRGAQAPGEGEA